MSITLLLKRLSFECHEMFIGHFDMLCAVRKIMIHKVKIEAQQYHNR